MRAIRRNRDRRQFAAARVLVRRVLSRYAPVEPEVWEFAYSSLGKPSIAPRFGLSDLRFNSAHTRDLVACAVAHQDDVGVDVECLDHDPGPLVARHSLSDEERAQYEQLRSIEQNRYFFRLWTLKEAYAKVRGLGLSLPFPHISFTVTSDCGAVVSVKDAGAVNRPHGSSSTQSSLRDTVWRSRSGVPPIGKLNSWSVAGSRGMAAENRVAHGSGEPTAMCGSQRGTRTGRRPVRTRVHPSFHKIRTAT